MDVKTYLSQLHRLNQLIAAKEIEVKHISDRITNVTRNPQLDRVQTSPSAGTAKLIDKMIDLKDEVNRDIDRYVDLAHTIIEQIEAMADQDYKLLLTLRYINGHTWEQIAEEMHYTERWIYVLHRHALADFQKQFRIVHGSSGSSHDIM